MAHTHSHPDSPAPIGPLAARLVVGALAAIGVGVIIGAVLLWPSGHKVDIPLPFQNATGGAVTTEAGHVLSSSIGDCGSPSAGKVLTADPTPGTPGGAECSRVLVAIDSGPNAGATTLFEFTPGPGQPKLAAGDHIRIIRQVDQQGATGYGFYDYERTWPLVGLAAVFAVVIVAVAHWRGLLALVGIVVAFLVLVIFLLPALRDGAPTVPVALVASAAILYVVIYLAHGVSLRTSAALLGTLTSLLLAALPWWRLPDVVDELGRPVRSSPSFRGRRSFPGWYWASTSGGLVGFESWVQRDHLVALDFDASVVGIVSQPFWLCWTAAGGKRRRHAPDFLVRWAGGAVMVLDSRPAQLIGERDREAFAATGRACTALSWRYAVWDRLDGVVVANQRWLAGTPTRWPSR